MDLGSRLLKSGIEPVPVSESLSADMMVLNGEYYCATGSCVGMFSAVAFSPIRVRLVVSSDTPGILFFFSNATVVVANLSSLLAISHLDVISEGFGI